ncbi:MAG: ComF family protein, partial [Clostridia bacterium]|nr:ComF family protein [Clostridia bacterium]
MLKFFAAFRFIKDIFLPTCCPVCLKETEKSGICKECHGILEAAMLENPDFDFDFDGYTVRCSSVFSYEYEQVRSLVMFMKENPDKGVYMYAAAYLARAVRSLGLSEDTVITYVPRSTQGLRENGFDQSQLLARSVSRIVPHLEYGRLLKRHGRSMAQKRLTGKEREENVKGKFRAVKTDASPKNILITDDMFTTGSSVKECAAVLKSAYPDARIFCVTVARRNER